ncbi:uncharacterized protein LOC114535712 [Dendronephthya gigantea]|uniref:uncharacterized protein LOC114535712 n=1 Tax=Dendronephthya gigantea TaxID=151771 RepID=UPI00106D9C75|nr:uncharacterized protein LOC114535712 [Dendronephthya gigantea]
MNIKESLEFSSSYLNVVNVVGSLLGSFVIMIIVIFACVSRKQKKDRNTSQARIEESESEYQIPDVNRHQQGATSSDGVYTVPEPNIVYTDLDVLALNSGGGNNRRKSNDPPTQYAIIDEEKLNAARKKREERLYENVNITNNTKQPIYDNLAVNEINA